MSNFKFISSKFPEIFKACFEAEQTVYTKPINSGMFSRQAMELMVNWVYWMDDDYEEPYQNTLAAKIGADAFTRDVPPRIVRELHYIKKNGNNANHARRISTTEALVSVKHLFHWMQYVIKTYTALDCTEEFVEDHIPKEDPIKEKLRELALQRQALEKQRELIEHYKAEKENNEKDKEELIKLREELALLKEENKNLPVPEPIVSEALTRKLFIDADIKEAGWDLLAENVVEYQLDNFPKHINPTGTGFADYVLWGDNGLPLAVIEAKRTCENFKKGKNQAVIYADCLEKKFGQRPVIIYTNGLEIRFWDDQFAIPRKIHGYYSKDELQLLIDRRSSRKDLRNYSPDPKISNRYYQKEAIQRVFENFLADGKKLVQRNRRSLIVMATGTGKTRTAVSIVDLMMQANWVKKVLFLADRNALVTQAKRSFGELLPQCTSIDLTKEREAETTRIVFSTYQSMMNRIDGEVTPDGIRYGVGHFDLIIIDEAHRSIYNKYQDVFQYFDGLIVGLTATPREEADKDTYQFFNCEPGNPTYYYELDQAVNDKFLKPPIEMPTATNFLRRGIKYNELSDEDREQFEKAFAEYGEEPPDEINSAAINRWLYNKDTVVKILHELMTKGQRVNSGDDMGKTIIFATNQRHAEFIEEVFNEQYPEYRGKYCSVITYKDKYAQDSIDKFKEKDWNPRIAISVDMLDTGIDVPEILNLVFFKFVYSKSKFWQMVGRGTRLCEDLFGQGVDKESFYVFDCCGNFSYFEQNPEGRPAKTPKSISHRIFQLRILLAEALRFQDAEAQEYRNTLLDISHEMVKNLFDQRESKFSVKLRLPLIELFSKREHWSTLNFTKVEEISSEIGPIIHIDDEDEKAKLFDALLYQMEIAYCNDDPTFEKGKESVIQRASILESNSNINLIKKNLPLLQRIQSEAFWSEVNIPTLEYIRIQLRELMKLIPKGEAPIIVMDIEDEFAEVNGPREVYLPKSPQNYLDRVKAFIRNNKHDIVINKIQHNKPITKEELNRLEEILFDGEERGTKTDYERATSSQKPLGTFIRSIIGLDRSAALSAFSNFIVQQNLNANQTQFVNMIIDHFENKGVIDPEQLYEAPYTGMHMSGVDGVFGNDQATKIISIIQEINMNANKLSG